LAAPLLRRLRFAGRALVGIVVVEDIVVVPTDFALRLWASAAFLRQTLLRHREVLVPAGRVPMQHLAGLAAMRPECVRASGRGVGEGAGPANDGAVTDRHFELAFQYKEKLLLGWMVMLGRVKAGFDSQHMQCDAMLPPLCSEVKSQL